jgi:hypothetical protein
MYSVLLLSCCYFFNCHTRRVPDTRLKPDEYMYEYEILPAGMCMCMNFYP